ncbi:3-deoxy-7-phosphoheptulonate synthase [Corallococcus terminator]|uniref:3-deoxy-7-phosphoheptulonate synthase n=1 Tax=Corallococcus terminator TaxID=2316733 RepID=A0A3A8JK35_9BACT|nr:3-deoxy-7-phosphoheptulonate synthase [Corallococcus terminator]RKG89853.1 3-deoxy-7-phosphoheptulonate synthase [Corallococcus terminator]
MLIVMRPDATAQDIERVNDEIRRRGWHPHAIAGGSRTAIGITGNPGAVEPEPFRVLPGVADAVVISQPFKLVSREVKPDDSIVRVGNLNIGGAGIHVIAGPCSVESHEQIVSTAHAVKKAGATMLRGGAFKPRTSPYEFQGLKGDGLALLAEARKETGLMVTTEVKDTATLAAVAEHTDILQVGARNMQNFSLLEAVGETRKPVLLKRGISATIKELLMAAEYIVARGNTQVILCERGIRTFENMTRNTLDLNAIPMLKSLTHLPVFVDPSHGIGVRKAVPAMMRAAIAAGADGIIVEVHPDPPRAKSDGFQSLDFAEFEKAMGEVSAIAHAMGREMVRLG